MNISRESALRFQLLHNAREPEEFRPIQPSQYHLLNRSSSPCLLRKYDTFSPGQSQGHGRKGYCRYAVPCVEQASPIKKGLFNIGLYMPIDLAL